MPSAKTKRGQLRCCGALDFVTLMWHWGKVENILPSYVLSIFLTRCKELIQTPNLLRAPPESLQKVGAPSDVPATSWETFPSVLHLQSERERERDRDRENILHENNKIILRRVKSAKFKSGHTRSNLQASKCSSGVSQSVWPSLEKVEKTCGNHP